MGATNDAVNLILRGEPFRNFCHSFYDEFVEQNVAFRHRAGVKSLIIRRNLGGCCDWCQNLAGIYVYGEEPKDVYRRHDSCRCLVTSKFEGQGYQDVWSKKEFETQKEARIARLSEYEEKLLKQKRKTIDSTIVEEYNYSPTKNELRKRYLKDVEDGWISSLSGFDNYYDLYREIETKIVGTTTRVGTAISGQSRHFLQRVIGTSRNPSEIKNGVYKITKVKQGFLSIARSGVEITDIIEAIEHGTIKKPVFKEGRISQKYIGKKCTVTINPENGTLIQCNPNTSRKKK